MKKVLFITALVAGIGFAGLQQASAFQGMSGGCYKGGAAYSQLDAAAKAKVDKFIDETQGLRKQMVMKHAEERALMSAENPDPGKASKLAGELFDLRNTLQAKAEAAGVQGMMPGCGGPQGMMGPHHGHRRGMGMMQGGPGAGAGMPPAPAGNDAL
jgi:hypothetical protein